jgi:hypothetical protein
MWEGQVNLKAESPYYDSSLRKAEWNRHRAVCVWSVTNQVGRNNGGFRSRSLGLSSPMIRVMITSFHVVGAVSERLISNLVLYTIDSMRVNLGRICRLTDYEECHKLFRGAKDSYRQGISFSLGFQINLFATSLNESFRH